MIPHSFPHTDVTLYPMTAASIAIAAVTERNSSYTTSNHTSLTLLMCNKARIQYKLTLYCHETFATLSESCLVPADTPRALCSIFSPFCGHFDFPQFYLLHDQSSVLRLASPKFTGPSFLLLEGRA